MQQRLFCRGIHLLHHAKHRNVIGKRCHHAGCRDIVHIQHLYRRSSAVFQTSESAAVPLIRPNRTQEIEPITSMADHQRAYRQNTKRDSRLGISLFGRGISTVVEKRPVGRSNATRKFAKIWKPLIIFSGMNFSPSATSTATISTGFRVHQDQRKGEFNRLADLQHTEYIATRPPAIQPPMWSLCPPARRAAR